MSETYPGVAELMRALREARAELARIRELLVEALGVIDDWEECDTKNQHTNTIDAIERELWKSNDETLQPFRNAITTAEGKP